MDNFIESIVYFVDKFQFNKRAVITMHAIDPRVLKEIRSFLKNYQMKAHMKWLFVNSSPQMSSKDPSS
jgi:hypothetical protein